MNYAKNTLLSFVLAGSAYAQSERQQLIDDFKQRIPVWIGTAHIGRQLAIDELACAKTADKGQTLQELPCYTPALHNAAMAYRSLQRPMSKDLDRLQGLVRTYVQTHSIQEATVTANELREILKPLVAITRATIADQEKIKEYTK